MYKKMSPHGRGSDNRLTPMPFFSSFSSPSRNFSLREGSLIFQLNNIFPSARKAYTGNYLFCDLQLQPPNLCLDFVQIFGEFLGNRFLELFKELKPSCPLKNLAHLRKIFKCFYRIGLMPKYFSHICFSLYTRFFFYFLCKNFLNESEMLHWG